MTESETETGIDRERNVPEVDKVMIGDDRLRMRQRESRHTRERPT